MSAKKKLLFYFLLIAISITIFIVLYKYNETQIKVQKVKKITPNQAAIQFQQQLEQLNQNHLKKFSETEKYRLRKKLTLIASQISQLGDTSQMQNELKDVAKDLTQQDFIFYLNIAVNIEQSGDERLAAISLIKEGNDKDVILAALITEPVPFLKDTHRQEQEFAFRAFAIEGLQSVEVIQNIQNQIDSPFLIDRLMRQKEFLLRKAPSPEIQDHHALKKLIGN